MSIITLAVGLRGLEKMKKQSQSDGNHNCWLAFFILESGGDRELALTYLKRAATDRRCVASGELREWFEREEAFGPVRNDPRFQAVVNQTVL